MAIQVRQLCDSDNRAALGSGHAELDGFFARFASPVPAHRHDVRIDPRDLRFHAPDFQIGSPMSAPDAYTTIAPWLETIVEKREPPFTGTAADRGIDCPSPGLLRHQQSRSTRLNGRASA
jgi:hypothetical protein